MTSSGTIFDFVGPCPAWCVECSREDAADGHVVHHGPVSVTSVYGDGPHPLTATVRLSHFDQLPEARLAPPTDQNLPMIDVVFDEVLSEMQLTPAQARALATRLLTAADVIDPPGISV